MFGKIEFANFDGLTKAPQKVASACSALETSGLCGAKYKPLLYIGEQVSKGTNYWFIAEQTLVTANPVRHIVTIAVNEFNGVYAIIPSSIEVVFA